MIDIHHHCLPGVDDGPRDLSESVEMSAMAAEEGIDTIIVTPHVLRGRWRRLNTTELMSRVDALRAATNDTPHLLLGSEYFFSHDMTEVLRAGQSIAPLAGSRFVLLELPANSVPPLLEQPLYRAQLEGWIPVIAHPERNLVFQKHPELLASLVTHGARVQLTATSLTGAFGSAAQAAAEGFLRRRLVHFVATDAHDMSRRPPRIREATRVLEQLVGEEIAMALLVSNPAAVIANRTLPWDPDVADEPTHGFFTRLRSFFAPRQV
jgi:protein-tyrosine phosphatase